MFVPPFDATVPLAVWWAVTAGLAAVLGIIAVVDWRSLRIPDRLSLPLIAAGLGLAWAWPGLVPQTGGVVDHLIGAAGAYLLFAVLGAAIHRRTGQEALGLGDAKLFAAAGAWLGWQALPAVLLMASLAGLAFALIMRRLRGAVQIAFGPWIALGFLTRWLLGAGGF